VCVFFVNIKEMSYKTSDLIINRLITIRKKQLKIFEDLAIFEEEILCDKLPKSFDSIKTDLKTSN